MDITDLLRCSTLFPYTCGRSDGSGHPDRQGLLVTQQEERRYMRQVFDILGKSFDEVERISALAEKTRLLLRIT